LNRPKSETKKDPTCPKCGGKKLGGDNDAWCSVCGGISCPKCGSPRVIDGKVHNWEEDSLRCQICGWNREMVMAPVKSQQKTEKTEKLFVRQKCSTPGCQNIVDTRCNNGGICKTCRKKAKLEEKKGAIERQLSRLGERAKRREEYEAVSTL